MRIALTGELDLYSAPERCRILDALEGPGTIDLADVSFMTAAGLGELARVARRVGPRVVKLVGARPHVRRVLTIAEFDKLFLIE